MSRQVKRVEAHTEILNDEDSTNFLSAITTYDEKGNMLVSVNYAAPDEIEDKTEFKYDSKGRKTQEINYLSEDEISDKKEITYDDQDKVTSEEISYADGSKSIKQYEYNQEGHLISIVQVDEDDEPEEKEVIVTDDKGRPKEKQYYDYNDKLKERHFFEYDQQGRVIKRLDLGRKKKDFIAERHFTYDEQGNITKRLSLNKKGELIDIVKISYNEQGKMTENNINNKFLIRYTYDEENKTQLQERILPDGTVEYTSLSKFNEDGLLIQEEDPFKKVVYKYSFQD